MNFQIPLPTYQIEKIMKATFLFSATMFISMSGMSQWAQLGTTIIGDHTNHYYGYKVELDQNGEHVIIGASDNIGLGGNGNAEVFQFSGGAWIQKGSTLTGDNVGDDYGCSVDISDDASTIVVGAQFNSDVATYAGMVKVYEWNGTSWAQKGTDLLGQALEDRFGCSVSFNANGNVLAVGAPQWFYGPQGPGYTKVFEWDGTAWIAKGSIITGDFSGDFFGFRTSLSDSGDTLAISGINNNSFAGHVKIYKWDGVNWVLLGNPIVGVTWNDTAGESIDLSSDGSTISVGTSSHNSYNGHVRVFSFDGADWVQKGMDIEADTASTNCGYSSQLADDGNKIVVGENGYDGLPYAQGRVIVYDWNGSNWVQDGGHINGEAAFEQFGWSCAISGNGAVIAAGAPSADLTYGDQGYVKLYGDTDVGINVNDNTAGIKIYPVPATDKITLEIPIEFGNCEYKIYDLTGKMVLSGAGSGILIFDIGTLQSGIFVVQTTSINSSYTARQMIQKW